MRTADEALGGDHGLGAVLFEKGDNFIGNGWIIPHVTIFGKPAFERVGIVTLVAHDARYHLGGKSGGWPIESDSCERIAVKTLLCLPAQPCRTRIPVLPHRLLFYVRAQSRDRGKWIRIFPLVGAG